MEALLIIECPYCNARVDAKEIATHEWPDVEPEEGNEHEYRVTLLACALCHNALLAYQAHCGIYGSDEGPEEEVWSEPERVYPSKPALDLAPQIPVGIRKSLEQARQCLVAEAYEAAAVMCGRAIEGLCRHFIPGAYLGSGLPGLKARGIIDVTLLEWGEQLQRHRNIGAHAGDANISKDDAVDLFDFAFAICDYVFVLSEKFRNFRERTDRGGQPAATVQ